MRVLKGVHLPDDALDELFADAVATLAKKLCGLIAVAIINIGIVQKIDDAIQHMIFFCQACFLFGCSAQVGNRDVILTPVIIDHGLNVFVSYRVAGATFSVDVRRIDVRKQLLP